MKRTSPCPMRWTANGALALSLTLLTGAVSADAQAVEQIQSRALPALDAWQASAGASLPAGAWRKSDAAALGALFDKAAPYASPAATRLARAALGAGGEAPAGDPAAIAQAANKRFTALARFGAADEIAAMIAVAPDIADQVLLPIAAEADFARARPGDACGRVQSAENSVYALTLRAYCIARAGQEAAASVAVDVAHSAGGKSWALSAIPALVGAGRTMPARYDSAFDATISIAAKLRPAPGALAKAPALALQAVARNEGAPALLRAQAAQTLLSRTALDPRPARAALKAAEKIARGAPSFAAALRAAAAAKDSAAKAKAVAAALARATKYQDYAALARLLHDDMNALPHDAANAGAAWQFARANLAAEDVAGAIAWRNLAAQAAPQSPIGPQRAIDCAIVTAGGGDAAAARAAIDNRLQFSGPRVARDAALFAALGLKVPDRARDMIAATADAKTVTPADPAILAAMTQAAQSGADGETALLAARAIGGGAHMIDRASLISVVQALRGVGLNGFAQQIALEAMIGAGLE